MIGIISKVSAVGRGSKVFEQDFSVKFRHSRREQEARLFEAVQRKEASGSSAVSWRIEDLTQWPIRDWTERPIGGSVGISP
jgi:hypothetical protein